jgi:hypothetical protein
MKTIQAMVLLSLIIGCSQSISVGSSNSALCFSATAIGDCGQTQVVKTDGTQCPAPSAMDSNTCNQHNDPTGIAVTSCSTVMSFHPELAGNHNTHSSPNCDLPGFPPCTVDTGWFEMVAECCVGGGAGPGAVWGELKICCQVIDGQSPAKCDTPCGVAGNRGCKSCTPATSGGVGGSCTISTGRIEDNSCPRGLQFFETLSVQDINGCNSDNPQ